MKQQYKQLRYAKPESQSVWQKVLNIFPWWREEADIICWNEDREVESIVTHPETRYRMVWKKLDSFKSLNKGGVKEVFACCRKE